MQARKEQPSAFYAATWAKLGHRFAYEAGWTSDVLQFRMLSLLAVAAQRRPDSLSLELEKNKLFMELPATNDLRIEYMARQVDYLHMLGKWRTEFDYLERDVIPASRALEHPTFVASRHLAAARAGLRAGVDLSRIATLLEYANRHLSVGSVEPHPFFHFWLDCLRAEQLAASGANGEAITIFGEAREQRARSGFDVLFLNDTRDFLSDPGPYKVTKKRAVHVATARKRQRG